MAFLLLKGGTVLIHGDGDKVSAVKADILVKGDRISKIGPDISTPNDADIIDCTDKLVSPGFIDTHHHVWQAPLKGLLADCSFSHYLGIRTAVSKYFTPEDGFWGNLAGCMEAIDAGTTTAISGSISSGIRSIFAYTPTIRLEEHQPELKFDELWAPWIMDTFETMAKANSLQDPASRVRLGFGFDYYFLPKETVISIFDKVRSLGARVITSHCNLFKGDLSIGLPVLLKGYGLLDDRIVFSHGGSIRPEDVKLLQEANTYVSVTPNTEQSMAVGPSVCFRDDLPDMDKLCSLGVDCHSATSSSIVNEMRTALQFARGVDSVKHLKKGKLPDDVFHKVEEVFNMGTIQGARALGMEKDIGSIAVGKKADLTIINAMSPAMFGAAQQDPIGAIVFHSSVGDVDTVVVDGRVRKLDGKLRPVKRFEGKNGDISKTGEELGWKDVAKRVLETQKRMVDKISEYDTRNMGDQVAKMINAK
ncbi:hypothetical protein ACJ41O_014610 [Fusarium nematophilum]